MRKLHAALYSIPRMSMILLIAPLQLLAQLLFQASTWLSRHPYYWLVVQRRRVLGEDTWQKHDLMLGIYPPEGHPFYYTNIQVVSSQPGLTVLEGTLPEPGTDDDPEPPAAA